MLQIRTVLIVLTLGVAGLTVGCGEDESNPGSETDTGVSDTGDGEDGGDDAEGDVGVDAQEDDVRPDLGDPDVGDDLDAGEEPDTPEDVDPPDMGDPDTGEAECPERSVPEALAFRSGPQDVTVTYDNDGTPSERRLTLVAPRDFDSRSSYPIYFLFHGSGGGAQGLIRQCDQALQAGGRFLCVVPWGAEQLQGQGPGWNLGSGQTAQDDLAFILSVWGTLAELVYIDQDSVYALGFSMGSAFSGNVLTRDPCSPFTGVVQSASQLWLETTIESPNAMKVIILHGEQDNLIPIDGGLAFGTTNFLSVDDSLSVWAEHNGCGGPPSRVESEDFTRLSYDECEVPVVAYRLNGQAHGTDIRGWYGGEPLMLADEIFSGGELP